MDSLRQSNTPRVQWRVFGVLSRAVAISYLAFTKRRRVSVGVVTEQRVTTGLSLNIVRYLARESILFEFAFDGRLGGRAVRSRS